MPAATLISAAFHSPNILHRIFNNLLHNAGKYSIRNGIVTTKIEIRKFDFNIRIQNKGQCLESEDEYRKIFQQYYRASNSDNIEGEGQGLTVARALCETMEGGLKLKHSKKKGFCEYEFIINMAIKYLSK